MAKIPMGNFGNAMPQVQRIQMPQDQSGQMLAGALQNFGKAAEQIHQNQLNKEVDAKKTELLMNDQQSKQDTAQYIQQSAKFSADIDLMDADITAKVQSGSLPIENAVQERQSNLEKIKKEYMPNIPNTRKMDFDQYIDKTSYQSASKYMPVAFQSARSQASVQMNDLAETLLKSSQTVEEGEQALRQFGMSKNLPIANVENAVNKYKNSFSTNGVNAWFAGNMDDNEQLSLMTKPEEILKTYSHLTQEQAIYYGQKNLNRIDQNNKAIEAAQKRIDADAKDATTEMRQITETGILPDDAKVQSLYSRVRGTKQELEFQKLAANTVEVQKFMRMPPDARQAYLSQLETDAHSAPSDDPKGLGFRLDLLKKANNNMLGNEKNNASLAYSIKTGRDLPVVPTTLIAQGDAGAIEILSNNVKNIISIHQDNGITGSLNPLSQQQQNEMKQYLSVANSVQKLQLGTSLFKASAGNANAARDMINSVFGDKNSIRWAISLNNRNHSVIANQIVSGQDLLDKGLVKPSESALMTKTTDYLKGIAAPGSPEYKIYYDSVKANYAYLAQKSEKLTDKSGKLDTKNIDNELFEKAVLEVTGGKFTSGSMWGRSTVLRPHTVSEKSFQDQLEAFNSLNSRTYGGSDKDYFLDFPLEQDPKNPYRYFFKNGSGYVLDKSSNRDPKKQTRLALVLH
ncbi:hypothetical protein [Acinetobacter soli]|uniref:Uncharacterized protein n=1 Tax=Acinetobacter soli NIPH 2899 TaxID=1217677 RepID=A0ABN0JZR2_9GAMM|nr:hypothetical protein [Acinetobacter soli]ENV60986.1 hypothetical protein F950_00231 [Acinetobacter soli NIPH 2899]